MNEVLIEMAKQVPGALAVIGTVYLFLKAESERENRRIANAKEMEMERRAHEIEKNNMWSSFIKNLIDSQNNASAVISNALAEHEIASKERYEKMGITNDLLKVAKETLKK